MFFVIIVIIIVFGVMVERIKLLVYIIFLFFNILIYCILFYWEWVFNGFLWILGMVDVVGVGVVYFVGGVLVLVVIFILKLRLGRYDNGIKFLFLGNLVSVLIGMFMFW